ncbi:AbrB/MazE/SpoVT family DNA-binding domain-containing protein [Candidatus Bathyarchaeota archaeon]|nr:AbrB/MazE/SpoVT family DNA-binding domain-containing protein [Candidatus Bathyarchaeota archaeon]
MAYEVKVTRQGQTTIPKALREKYRIKEGDTVIYVDLGDHIALLPSPKDPLKILAGLKIDVEETVYEMKKEALKSAQELVDRKLGR